MRILLTNDDGIEAIGLLALRDALLKAGHEVKTVAPDGQRSAAGHGLSFHHASEVRKTDIGYAISGQPADCVKLGLTYLAKDCEMVVAGINKGGNVGVDVHYSGTLGAAMEGLFCGRPAVGFSMQEIHRGENYQAHNFADAAYLGELAAGVVDALIRRPLPPRTLLNVNFPNLKRGDALRYVVAPMGFQTYEEGISEVEKGKFEYSNVFNICLPENGCDCDRLFAGDIVLTPLTWDMTAHGAMGQTEHLVKDFLSDPAK